MNGQVRFCDNDHPSDAVWCKTVGYRTKRSGIRCMSSLYEAAFDRCFVIQYRRITSEVFDQKMASERIQCSGSNRRAAYISRA